MPRLWGGEVSACAEVAGRESTRILTDRDPRIRTQTPKPPRRIRPFVGAGQSQTVHPLPRTHRILLLPSPAHTAAWHPAGKCRHGGGSELRAGGFPGAIIAVPADEPRHRITSSRGTGYHTHTRTPGQPRSVGGLLRMRAVVAAVAAAAAAEPLEIAVCLQVLPPPPPPLAGRGDSGSGPVSCGGLRRRLHRCPGPGGGGRRSAHSPGFVHAPQYTLTYSNTVLFPSPAVCAATMPETLKSGSQNVSEIRVAAKTTPPRDLQTGIRTRVRQTWRRGQNIRCCGHGRTFLLRSDVLAARV